MFALAIANPLTILFFTIVIPAFGVVISGDSLVSPAIFVTGVFFGEADLVDFFMRKSRNGANLPEQSPSASYQPSFRDNYCWIWGGNDSLSYHFPDLIKHV